MRIATTITAGTRDNPDRSSRCTSGASRNVSSVASASGISTSCAKYNAATVTAIEASRTKRGVFNVGTGRAITLPLRS